MACLAAGASSGAGGHLTPFVDEWDGSWHLAATPKIGTGVLTAVAFAGPLSMAAGNHGSGPSTLIERS